MNMTANAIMGNLETVECTCSWNGNDSMTKVLNFEEHFNKVWSGNCEGVRIYDAKYFCSQIIKSYPNQDPELLLKREEEFIKSFKQENLITNIKFALYKKDKIVIKKNDVQKHNQFIHRNNQPK